MSASFPFPSALPPLKPRFPVLGTSHFLAPLVEFLDILTGYVLFAPVQFLDFLNRNNWRANARFLRSSAFVRQLLRNPSVCVSVATGGWEATALIKLSAIGLDPRQLPIASSSDAVSKIDIMQIAERRAIPAGEATRRTYFGDSPYDKEVSQELGYDFIAIGDRVKHRHQYSDFRETESILQKLGLR